MKTRVEAREIAKTRVETRALVVSGALQGEVEPPRSKAATKARAKGEGRAIATKREGRTITTAAKAASVKEGVYRIVAKGVMGLHLKVAESGAGSYFWRYSFGQKRDGGGDLVRDKDGAAKRNRREMGLGSRDQLKFADACERARELAVLIDKGIDPIEARRKTKADAVAASESAARAVRRKQTFAEAAEAYARANERVWKSPRSQKAWINPLIAYAYPIIGDLGLSEITFEHVVKVMKAAEAADTQQARHDWRATTGRKDTAKRLRAKIEAEINVAIVTKRLDPLHGNPADMKLIKAAHPQKRRGEKTHYRSVELYAAPAIFRALMDRARESTAVAVWAFMIATAARPSEALNARWSEIDLDKKLWTIPADRMEAGREHVVPLSSIALKVLARQKMKRTGDSVFPGRSGSPISYNCFSTTGLYRNAGRLDAGAPHGWRSVFRDWAGDESDFPRDLCEAALAHALNSTEGSYRRRSAVQRRRVMMEVYADWLEGRVPLRRADDERREAA
jgi:integrase